jgi:hypothetical protein
MDVVEFPKVIVRHAAPSKLDQAKPGTKCHVLKPFSNQVDVYIQISSNEEDPVWEYSGHLIE